MSQEGFIFSNFQREIRSIVSQASSSNSLAPSSSSSHPEVEDDELLGINTFEEISQRSSHTIPPGEMLNLYEMDRREEEEEEDLFLLRRSFFPEAPAFVLSSPKSLHNWSFNVVSKWSKGIISLYKSTGFTHSLEEKQLSHFKLGTSTLLNTSGSTFPYREKTYITIHKRLVEEIGETWKPMKVEDLDFVLYKEKNPIAQKISFMIEFCKSIMTHHIPYLKGTIHFIVDPDEETITHLVTISTWLAFGAYGSGFSQNVRIAVHETILNRKFFYALKSIFTLLFTKTNELF